jgi:N-methylhydantoinase A
MSRILCPRASGVLAALGLVVSDRRRDAQRSVLLSGAAMSAAALRAEVAALAERAGPGERRVTAELRYRGQSFELAVECGEEPQPDELREAFAAAHERAYGYRDEEGEVELVTLHVTATEPGPEIDAAAAGAAGRGATTSTRRAWFGGAEREAAVITGEPEPGVELEGPAICELPEATLAVPPGWAGRVEPSGTIRLERAG